MDRPATVSSTKTTQEVSAREYNVLVLAGEPVAGGFIAGVLDRLARAERYDIVVAGGGGVWPGALVAAIRSIPQPEDIGISLGIIKKHWISEEGDLTTERLFAVNPPWRNCDRLVQVISTQLDDACCTALRHSPTRFLSWYIQPDGVATTVVSNENAERRLQSCALAHTILPGTGISHGYDPLDLPPIDCLGDQHGTPNSRYRADVVWLGHAPHLLSSDCLSRHVIRAAALDRYCRAFHSVRYFGCTVDYRPMDFSSQVRTGVLTAGRCVANLVMNSETYRPEDQASIVESCLQRFPRVYSDAPGECSTWASGFLRLWARLSCSPN